MNKTYKMKQLRRALELFVETITDESTMMEVADVYSKWQVGKTYKTGNVFAYGVNADNETQLYTVLQAHTSAAEHTPDIAVSLYKKVGFTEDGIAIWTQPLGATDAYMKGDKVLFNGVVYISTVDNNTWSPDTYGWEIE